MKKMNRKNTKLKKWIGIVAIYIDSSVFSELLIWVELVSILVLGLPSII